MTKPSGGHWRRRLVARALANGPCPKRSCPGSSRGRSLDSRGGVARGAASVIPARIPRSRAACGHSPLAYGGPREASRARWEPFWSGRSIPARSCQSRSMRPTSVEAGPPGPSDALHGQPEFGRCRVSAAGQRGISSAALRRSERFDDTSRRRARIGRSADLGMNPRPRPSALSRTGTGTGMKLIVDYPRTLECAP